MSFLGIRRLFAACSISAPSASGLTSLCQDPRSTPATVSEALDQQERL